MSDNVTMDGSAVALLKELAQKAAGPVTITGVGNEPPHVFYVRLPNGTYERREGATHPDAWRFGTLESLADETIVRLSDEPVCFVRSAGVDVRFRQPNAARNSLHLPLQLTDEFKTVMRLASETPDEGHDGMSQAELWRLLRVELAHCVPSDTVTAIEQVKIRKGNDGEAEVRAARQSVSARTLAEVSGVDSAALPQEVVVTVPVFEALRPEAADKLHPVHVQCAIEVNASAGQFYLTPLAGELSRAILDTLAEIREAFVKLLKDANDEPTAAPPPVYIGA